MYQLGLAERPIETQKQPEENYDDEIGLISLVLLIAALIAVGVIRYVVWKGNQRLQDEEEKRAERKRMQKEDAERQRELDLEIKQTVKTYVQEQVRRATLRQTALTTEADGP